MQLQHSRFQVLIYSTPKMFVLPKPSVYRISLYRWIADCFSFRDMNKMVWNKPSTCSTFPMLIVQYIPLLITHSPCWWQISPCFAAHFPCWWQIPNHITSLICWRKGYLLKYGTNTTTLTGITEPIQWKSLLPVVSVLNLSSLKTATVQHTQSWWYYTFNTVSPQYLIIRYWSINVIHEVFTFQYILNGLIVQINLLLGLMHTLLVLYRCAVWM